MTMQQEAQAPLSLHYFTHTPCSTRHEMIKYSHAKREGKRLSRARTIYLLKHIYSSLPWILAGTEPQPVELLHLHILSLPLSLFQFLWVSLSRSPSNQLILYSSVSLPTHLENTAITEVIVSQWMVITFGIKRTSEHCSQLQQPCPLAGCRLLPFKLVKVEFQMHSDDAKCLSS